MNVFVILGLTMISLSGSLSRNDYIAHIFNGSAKQ